MTLLTGKALSHALRQSVDRATERLWLASPYIGGWAGQVRPVLGTAWQTNVADVRLLLDVDAQGFKLSTLRQFLRRGEVRTSQGLHAKLYVADDRVILTSANLTGTAFSRRYEAGVLLTGRQAQNAAMMFEGWWSLGTPRREEQLVEPAPSRNKADEPPAKGLPVLSELPRDVADAPLPDDTFGDYSTFLEAFNSLCAIYKATQRMWREVPLNFEVDGLLNYLYHDAPGTPSRAYAGRRPRKLFDAQRVREIRRYAAAFANACRDGESSDNRTWRSETVQEVRRLLNANKRTGLSWEEIRETLEKLNSMQAYGVNLAQIMNRKNNRLSDIRATFRDLVDEKVPVQRRMSDAMGRVQGFGKSSIQELVGFYSGGKLPLRNQNINCGLRFFGFDVRVS